MRFRRMRRSGDRSFTMPVLTFDDMGDIEHPDTDPELQVPMAVVGKSRH